MFHRMTVANLSGNLRKRSFLLLALSVCVAIPVLMPKRVNEVRSVTLPNGMKVTLVHATFGKKHFSADVPFWQRLILRCPTNIAAAFGLKARLETTPVDTMIVRIQWEGYGLTNPPPLAQYIRIRDANGLASSRVADELRESARKKFHVTSIPRDQPALSISLFAFEYSTNAPRWVERHIADFTIANPAFSRRNRPMVAFPETTNVSGDEFSLLQINTGLVNTGRTTFAGSTPWTELVFRFGTNAPGSPSSDDPLSREWFIGDIELTDRFGNIVENRFPIGRGAFPPRNVVYRAHDGIALFDGALWPNEKWNVRAELFRIPNSSFYPTQSWTFSMPVPGPGDYLQFGATGRVETCEILVKSIESDGASPPLLNVAFKAPELLSIPGIVRVVDERGSNIAWSYLTGSGGITHSGAEDTWYKLHTFSGAKTVKVTFALTHGIVLNLSGKAAILHTNIARWQKLKP